MSRTLLLVLAGVLAPSALPAGGDPPPTGMAPPKRIPQLPAPLPPSDPIPTASVPREVRRAVVADAARRFKVDENLVVVASAERLTWTDGSLGCPMPGMNYTQALVPGYRIVAKSADGSFIYLTDASGNLAVCDMTSTAVTGQPGYGVSNGVLNNDDFFYYLALFAGGC